MLGGTTSHQSSLPLKRIHTSEEGELLILVHRRTKLIPPQVPSFIVTVYYLSSALIRNDRSSYPPPIEMEDQLVTFVNEYLATCTGKPAILKAIKNKYHVDFQTFGLGKYNEWLNRNKHRLNIDAAKAKATVIGLKARIPEAELLLFVRDSLKRNGCLNYALSELRGKYGDGDFARFGYGTFVEFVTKYGLR